MFFRRKFHMRGPPGPRCGVALAAALLLPWLSDGARPDKASHFGVGTEEAAASLVDTRRSAVVSLDGWHYGAKGQNCNEACAAASLKCVEGQLEAHNNEVTAAEEETAKENMQKITKDLNECCESYKFRQGSRAPAIRPEDGKCLVSKHGRGTKTYNCSTVTGPKWKRLCWCVE